MRKIIIAALAFVMMTCIAFAEGENGDNNGQQGATFDISLVEMTLDQTEYEKTGNSIEPGVTLKYDGADLDATVYPYEIEYANNVNVGTATATVAFSDTLFPEGTAPVARSKSMTFEIVPARPAAASITKVTSSKPNVTVAWNKVSCSGYELQISQNSSFSGASTYKQTATSKTFGGLIDSRTYYFRVRPYNTENGKTAYGDWRTYSSVVRTTGEVGNRYCLNGAYVYDRTVKSGENYYYYDGSGIKRACSKTMWNKVRNTKSNTKYLIAVDCSQNRVCVYQGKKGKWNLKYYWKCSTGKSSTPTIKGTFKVCGKVSHFGEKKGYSVWYATRIKYEYYFHSILYKPYSKKVVKNGRLGANLSHGCIRLEMKNAKWIYKNCKKKTRIIIY
ncbi:MAG: L,D-transpeptidase [Firmicutes bacterium]|nr:L,D-transpeptidase [Bacillota bacterium]